jgi:MFS family permease
MIQTDAAVLAPASRERIYRHNFIYFLTDSILFSVAIAIIGSTTVIPDFVRRLTDSEILIGLSGNLFTIGYTLPQLLIARYIVRYARKKWWFVGPNIPVRFVILIFAGIVVWLGRDRPELVLLAFFICYGLAALGDGVVGVPWADLMGTSLDERWRARMLGLTSAVTGLTMLVIAPLIGVVLGENGPGFPNNYATLFAISGTLFVISIIPCLFIRELPGGAAVEKIPALGEFLPGLGRMLRDDLSFRAFIITRMFTNLFLMSAPFYIGYATVQLGESSAVAVPILLAMETIGAIGGALIYTWMGARNNLLYLRLALASAVLLPVCALMAGFVGPVPLYIGFLISGLASSNNLLFSLLNWIVSYSSPDQRPVYVGLSNTITAIISLITPFIAGTIAQNLGYPPLFAVSLVMALCALFVSLRYLRNARAEIIPAAAVSTV